MIVRIDMNITPDEMAHLETTAALLGYLRTEPRKVWTDKERKEMVRWVAHKKLLKKYG